MNTKYCFSIVSALYEQLERKAEIPVNISSSENRYHVCGDGFLATVEAKELPQLCPNKRIIGRVVSTEGQTPIFVGENIQMIFLEKGKSKVKILLDSMSPEVLVKRFLREGEINEAERIIRKIENLLKFAFIFGFFLVCFASMWAGFHDTFKPAIWVVTFAILCILLYKSYKKELTQVFD